MNNAIQLGPLLLPYALLLVFASAGATVLVGNRVGKKAGVEAETALWQCLLVGLVAARLAFVFEYRSLYFASPFSILDIRDGGWNPAVGLAGTWLYAIHPGAKSGAAQAAALGFGDRDGVVRGR